MLEYLLGDEVGFPWVEEQILALMNLVWAGRPNVNLEVLETVVASRTLHDYIGMFNSCEKANKISEFLENLIIEG
jgi:hypothetical protein